ncbi:MAG: hypothetical protein WA303_17960, partial [Bradyrhizobium sp.]
MDMIVHVSLFDLQRNLDDYSSVGDPTLDNFAPGWRDAISVRQANAPLRAALVEYWLGLIRSTIMSMRRNLSIFSMIENGS